MPEVLPRWIASARIDSLAFFGTGTLALAVGAWVVVQPAALVVLFWLWLLCIDGPHLLATVLRLHWGSGRSAQESGWIRLSWLAYLPPLAAWLLAQLEPAWRSMELLLGAGALLSWYHLSRQHEGICAIYHAQTAKVGIQLKPALERRWLRCWLWGVFALSAAITPAGRTRWQLSAVAVAWLDALAVGLALMVLAFIAAYSYEGWRRRRLGASLRPWVFGFFPVGCVSTLALLGVGWLEPLQPGASGTEQVFMAVTLMTGLVHGLQYLVIVLAANIRRYGKPVAVQSSRMAWLASRPWTSLGALMALSWLLYLALNASRSSLPGWHWLALDSSLAQLAATLYWGLFFQHYYIDSKVWRIASQPALRHELGIT